jgi:2-aminoadipate transaminase
MRTRVPFSQKALRTQEQPISYLMQAAVQNRDLISLAAGLVDEPSLPVEVARDLVNEILAEPDSGQMALQYGTTHGYLTLRRQVLQHLCQMEGCSAEDLNLSVENVIISTGSQQMLFLVSDVLLDPGDIVIVSAPSYFVYTGTLASFGVSTRAAAVDAGGTRIDEVRRRLEELAAEGNLARCKLIYEMSYYQNPTGLTLAADRRRALVELAREFSTADHRILVLEDAAYRELCYDGGDLPSVKRYDPDNEFVVLCQTFSKPFSPGLKTGYTFLPDELVEPVLHQKGNHDFGSNNFAQHLISRAIETGAYARQVKRLRETYRRKRDVMLSALDDEFGDFPGGPVSCTRPGGGLYVWATFPPSVPTPRDGALFAACLGEGVLYVPGEYCYEAGVCPDMASRTMRLCFGVVPQDKIVEGVRRLARAARRCVTAAARA